MTTVKASRSPKATRFPLCTKYGLELIRTETKEGTKRTQYQITSVPRASIEKMLQGRGADWVSRFWENCPDEPFPAANDVEHILIVMERGGRGNEAPLHHHTLLLLPRLRYVHRLHWEIHGMAVWETASLQLRLFSPQNNQEEQMTASPKFRNGALCDRKERTARIERIIEAYRRGDKVHWIAAQEGVTASYVSNLSGREGLRRRDAHPL